ncbi:MAG: cyclase family protein [Hyphomicrobiaceae bacterium]
MCAPGCIEYLARAIDRRGLLVQASGLVAGVAAATAVSGSSAQAQQAVSHSIDARRVFDLTHTLTPEFPTFDGKPGIALRPTAQYAKSRYNMMQWTVQEHSGTHIDAPIHFSEKGVGPAELPVETLVVPLAVIDVSAKAGKDADYQLTASDIVAWEKQHGRLPDNGCVAMYSGWEMHLGTDRFAGRDNSGTMHFPGFHPDATMLLLTERRVAGIAVDTLSLDHGASKDFRTHYSWLPAGRWGLENVANLSQLPPLGATLIVGAPKIKGATGGPVRLMALAA